MTTRFLLHGVLTRAAERWGDRVAVVDGERSVTYRELDAESNRYARFFMEVGVGPGDRVGIYLDKSLEAVVAIYGALKAGAAYVPLDPRAPTTRLSYIVDDCGIEFMVSAAKLAGRWGDLAAETRALQVFVVDMDQVPDAGVGVTALGRARLSEEPGSAITDRQRIDEDLAYILYTSGSTGAPKGVMLSHRNGLAFVTWAAAVLQLTDEDRLSSHAPFHFDLSIFDIFASALSGASVALVPQATSVFPVEIVRFIERHRLTVWYSVPSILSLVVQHGNLAGGALPTLRHVVFAGEVFPSKYLADLMHLVPHANFHNWYGPTETNVCTAYTVPAPPDPEGGDIPIGRSIDNVQTFVVGASGSPVGPGEEGELHVRGATVMHGYWGDEAKTNERLHTHGLNASADRAYATGDLVVEMESGDYRFRGRRDHQIKSRGYRIELGEIETALNAHPLVVESVVIAVPDDVVTNRLRAFVAVRTEVDSGALVAWCAERIPRYMIPEHFEFLEELPKTSTGKVDRQAVQRIT